MAAPAPRKINIAIMCVLFPCFDSQRKFLRLTHVHTVAAASAASRSSSPSSISATSISSRSMSTSPPPRSHRSARASMYGRGCTISSLSLGWRRSSRLTFAKGRLVSASGAACPRYAEEARSSVHLPQERSARGCHFSRGVSGSVR